MDKLRTFLSIFVLVVLTVLPTGSIAAYHPPQALKSSGNTSVTALTVPPDYPYTQNFPVVFKPGVSCHFGIAVLNTVTNALKGYDLSTLGVGNYLDWSRIRDSSVPTNIDYYRVLNVSDANYSAVKALVPTLLINNPGATWLIGNEPDSEVTYQDHVSAETYADRFYELATIIRHSDPKAKIGFGTIIMPTAVRIYYLTQAMNRLVLDAGGSSVLAHALIDIYSIHSFILNEQPLYDANGKNISWGAGVPVGYDPATWPAYDVINIPAGETYKTYDIDIFKARVIAFRQWMKDQGEQNKPLWITEFGSLFPSAGNLYLQVSDADTANYMVQTFDFMLGYKDPSLGFGDDDNRLVQKWDWYSLNQQLDTFGGSFFNPLNHMITPVGNRFLQYNPSTIAVPVVNPDVYVMVNSLSITPFSPSNTPGLVNYKFSLKFSNNLSSDRSTGVQIDIFDGPALIYSNQTDLPRCGGASQVVFLMNNLPPGEIHTFSAQINLLTGNGIDTNLVNNSFTFAPIVLQALLTTYFPAVYR